MDQNAANFLRERIRRQAQAEGMPLSSEEEMFLELAAAGRKEEAHEALKRLQEHESMREFGSRLVGLLSRAYEEDLKSDPQAKERYAQNVQAFTGGGALFSMVLPLMFGDGHSPEGPSQPVVAPKSSPVAVLLVLVFLLFVGMVLWMVIFRR
jgi:hypothetical protein